MGAKITNVSGKVLTITITGKLTQPELAAAQKSAGGTIKSLGKARFLVITENFLGWERGGDWGDVSFSAEYDPYIEKIAIVAERKWEDLSLMFASKGIRPIEIEYFEPADLPKARAWLGMDSKGQP